MNKGQQKQQKKALAIAGAVIHSLAQLAEQQDCTLSKESHTTYL